MSMNISAMNSGLMYTCIDAEHQRIIRELRALGIEPTFNKATDKAKLEAAQSSQKVETSNKVVFKPVNSAQEADKNRAFSVEDEAKNSMNAAVNNMTGAEQIAQFNKLKLLGMY